MPFESDDRRHVNVPSIDGKTFSIWKKDSKPRIMMFQLELSKCHKSLTRSSEREGNVIWIRSPSLVCAFQRWKKLFHIWKNYSKPRIMMFQLDFSKCHTSLARSSERERNAVWIRSLPLLNVFQLWKNLFHRPISSRKESNGNWFELRCSYVILPSGDWKAIRLLKNAYFSMMRWQLHGGL